MMKDKIEKKNNKKKLKIKKIAIKKTKCTVFESTTDDGVTPRNEVARAPRVWRLHHTR
jgi:hypothetical protein